MWYWWVFRLWKFKCRKKLIDKLVEGCTENVEEVKLGKITSAEDENKHKCSSCTLYIVLFSMIFTSKVGIGTYFVYYKYMNGNKELLLNMILFINYQLINWQNVVQRHWYLLHWYITIKKIDEYENIHSVNPPYLIIHSPTVHFKEKNDDKYLILDPTDKYEEVWSRIRSKIKSFNGGKLFFEKTTLELELILMMICLWINH